MKTVRSNVHRILAAGAALALGGITLAGTARAGHDERGNGRRALHDARALDRLTDRLHSLAKRELRRGHDSRRTLARICELEDRADRLRSGIENRIPAAAVSHLACAVEGSAREVVLLLRRSHCGWELNELALLTLDHARAAAGSLAGRGSRFDWDNPAPAPAPARHGFDTTAGHGHGHGHGYEEAWRPGRDARVRFERGIARRGF